jgi:hypothetical protein
MGEMKKGTGRRGYREEGDTQGTGEVYIYSLLSQNHNIMYSKHLASCHDLILIHFHFEKESSLLAASYNTNLRDELVGGSHDFVVLLGNSYQHCS